MQTVNVQIKDTMRTEYRRFLQTSIPYNAMLLLLKKKSQFN